MGIPGFVGAWLRATVPSCAKTNFVFPGNVTSLAIDLNGLIYEVKGRIIPDSRAQDPSLHSLSESTIRQRIITRVGDRLLTLVNCYNPLEYLIVAVDGIPPLSKMQHQKQRHTIAGQQPNPFNFDPNCITPGTDFMFALDSYLREFFVSNQERLVPRVIWFLAKENTRLWTSIDRAT